MGWAARSNPNSKWNKKRAGQAVHPASTSVASPISNSSNAVKAPTPVKRDEPMVIEINLRSLWGILCRVLKLSTPRLSQSPAPIS